MGGLKTMRTSEGYKNRMMNAITSKGIVETSLGKRAPIRVSLPAVTQKIIAGLQSQQGKGRPSTRSSVGIPQGASLTGIFSGNSGLTALRDGRYLGQNAIPRPSHSPYAHLHLFGFIFIRYP